MAIEKSLPTQFGGGDTADYWNIGEIHEDFRAQNLRAVLFGYTNSSARAAAKEPKSSATILIDLAGGYTPGMGRGEAYARIKLQPEFVGGRDV